MSLSSNAVKRMIHALGDSSGPEASNAGNEVASHINEGVAASAQVAALSTGLVIPAAITATSTSTTTDFGALKVGDLLITIPAVAGNAVFETVATAGTKPSAAVVGDLYIVLRAAPTYTAPSASAVKL